jgi:hypothetical protein
VIHQDLSAGCCALVISADRLPCLRASRRTTKTFRSAAFCSVCLQTPLSWVWPLRDGHDFSLPLRFLDHFLLTKSVGRVRSMFRACSTDSLRLVFLLAKKDVRFEASISPIRLLPQLADPTGVEARCTSLLPLAVFKDFSSDSQRPPAGVPADI